MSTIQKFEEIISWQEARKLNIKVGKLIDDDKLRRNFRLVNQIEGSSGSIMDNIAEGFERSGNREFIQFLYIAKGSCGELRSQLYRCIDRNYITQTEFDELSVQTNKINFLIQKLINYIENSGVKGNKYKAREKTLTQTT